MNSRTASRGWIRSSVHWLADAACTSFGSRLTAGRRMCCFSEGRRDFWALSRTPSDRSQSSYASLE